MNEEEFQAFLRKKNIDPLKFLNGDPAVYSLFFKELQEMHPESFLSRQLFNINKIRRAYQLQKESSPTD